MTSPLSEKSKFEQSLAHGITLVDFNAPWCRPCRDQTAIIYDIIDRLKDRFSDAVRIKIIDIESHREIAFRLGIQSIPTIIIYKNGREVDRFIGLQSGATLIRTLLQLIH